MFPRYLMNRETGASGPSDSLQREYQMCSSFLSRLGLFKELVGHSGCVNCIQWNETGDLLASGSDDLKVNVWRPFTADKSGTKVTIKTNHFGNIFSVKFMPFSNDSVICSGAGDSQVHVHDVNSPDNGSVRVFDHHFGRVKRIDVTRDTPHLLFSGAEDGLVMQMDTRARDHEAHILVNLNSVTTGSLDLKAPAEHAEVKCVAVNPIRSELLAVGANDPYVRLYDRRNMKCQLFTFETQGHARRRVMLRSESISIKDEMKESVRYFVPGHLPKKETAYRRKLRPIASTFVTFSSDGKEILANLGGEQIYLYDLTQPQEPLFVNLKNETETFTKTSGSSLGLEPDLEALKSEANAKYESKDYYGAIGLYNEVLKKIRHPVLLANRAAAFMKRNWDGDIYGALRDSYEAVSLDKGYIKAHLRLIRCLLDLGSLEEVDVYMDLFERSFPDSINTGSYIMLMDDRNKLRDAEKNREERESDPSNPFPESSSTSQSPSMFDEHILRSKARDYNSRFCGHCNTTTDIKEANFLGGNNELIMAGSDDGKFFVWDKKSTNIVKVMEGDESIVNCLQGHPSHSFLATSGIESVIRLWGPLPDDHENERTVKDLRTIASNNQDRMNADPFEILLRSIGHEMSEDSDNDGDPGIPLNNPDICRPS